MKKSWQWESPMGKMRGKELQTEQAIDQYLSYESEMDDNRQLMFEVITEKAKKRTAQPPTPSSNPPGYSNDLKQEVREGIARERDRSMRALGREGGRIFREADEQRSWNMNKKPPQLPSAGQKTTRVMPGSRVDINKQNKNAAKKNEAQMKRRKELFEATEKAKKRRDSTDTGSSELWRRQTPEEYGNDTIVSDIRRQNDKDTEAARKTKFTGYSANRLNDSKMHETYPRQVPSAARKTPKVMPGSRVDINKQNRDAAAGRKKNEAQMKRRKELQFDGSLVVGAESFFLQMVAATKRK